MWREHFIGPEDNWLPPDNFQEQPIEMIARRTSPTNIGLSLLANISACDFGYITTAQFIDRTANTISTMTKLELYKGHFYNWYDTESLNPLLPKYISTVDNGNLIGHLIVLKQGLLEVENREILGLTTFYGLRDTLYVFIDTIDEKEAKLLSAFKYELEVLCKADLISCHQIKFELGLLIKKFNAIMEIYFRNTTGESDIWKRAFIEQLENSITELQIFEPWFLLKNTPTKFSELISMNSTTSLAKVLKTATELSIRLNHFQKDSTTTIENKWIEQMLSATSYTTTIVKERISIAQNLAQKCDEMADMEWDFLYNKSSKLLTIGYNVQDQRMDSSSYDLLASEARLCTFICIAQGKLPEESWFALGRLLTNVNGNSILLSWSGSMFEYLMPLLVMPTYENTLLDQTCKAAVEWQISYGKQVNLPWGISESGYNMINANAHYQYRAFGAPGLGLKRGLEEDSVIAPYATALSLMVAPEEACKNLELLAKKGFEGRYGFYEAIDYTPSRLPRGKSCAIVYSYMAHHQGMTLLSLAYLLLDKPMQKLFELEPQFQATLLLLQERIPKASTFFAHTTNIEDIDYLGSDAETRIINTPNTPIPEIQLLSNGRYNVMVTNSGAGYSRWKSLSVSRWREDVTSDNWGTFCYIRDVKNENYTN